MSAAPVPSPRPDARVQTGIGWAPVLNVWLAHLPRLASGDAQVLSILYINAELHPPRTKGDTSPRPKFTRPITTEELAAYCRCTVRAIQTALEDLDRRKVITRRKTGAGFMYALPFASWPELPDRPPAKVLALAEPEQAPEDTEDDTPRKLEFELKQPLALKPGKKSRPVEMGGCAPGKFSFRNLSGADVAFSLSVSSGIVDCLLLKAEIPKENTRRSQTKPISLETTQDAETTKPKNLAPLHELLDDYCLRHHGTIPPDKILLKVCQDLGKATLDQFKTVLQAKIRAGKIIPIGLLPHLAQDAAMGAAASKPKVPVKSDPRNEQIEQLRVAYRFVQDFPDHPDAEADRLLLAEADPALLREARRRG